MRIFLLKILLFFCILSVIDFLSGCIFDIVRVNAKGGATYRDRYICDELTTDILLLGSSRCEHHYNPIIISDSIGLSCYNAGQSGNGILVAYARYLMVSKRCAPQMVIYDINPSFDLLKGYDNHRYLTWLKSYYDQDSISNIFNDVDKTERYKMLSSLYRYNSRIIEVAVDFIHPIFDDGIHGFIPINSKMNKSKINKKEINRQHRSYEFDSLKLVYLSKLIDIVGNKNIMFVISPRWYGMDQEAFKPLADLCKKKDVLFIDYANNSKYIYNDLFFKDGNHLNSRGANEFTKDLMNYIRNKSII